MEGGPVGGEPGAGPTRQALWLPWGKEGTREPSLT
jgi:hypothetical protein